MKKRILVVDDEQDLCEILRLNLEIEGYEVLTALLHDISTLNRMDYAPDMIKIERVNLSNIVADIVQETELARQKRNMKLDCQLPGNIVIKGNTSLIYSIFRNLFDNSINYAGEGTTISLKAVELS
ncbi:MAG: hypothetical protein ACSW8D_08340, partial [Prevotella sp.]